MKPVWVLLMDDRYSGSDGCSHAHWQFHGVYDTRESAIVEAECRMGSTEVLIGWEGGGDLYYAENRVSRAQIRLLKNLGKIIEGYESF